MKRVLICAALVAATVIISSCDNKDEVNEVVPSQAALRIDTDITRTRSVLSTFPSGSELGLFVTSGSIGINYNGVPSNANVKSTLFGSTWTQTPAVYLSNLDATIFAYYPYNAANINPGSIPVEHNSQTDYMTGTHTPGQSAVNNGNPTVRLTLEHALSLIQFKVNKSNYTGVGKLTKIEIANATGRSALASEGTVNVVSGNITNATGKNASASIEKAAGLIASIPPVASTDESTFPKVLVLPVASVPVAGDVVIKFTIDGKVYTWNVPASTAWLGGTKNTYTVTISGTNLAVGTVLIEDWKTGSTGTAGLK